MKRILTVLLLVLGLAVSARAGEIAYIPIPWLMSLDDGRFFAAAGTPTRITEQADLMLAQAYRQAEVVHKEEFTDAERAELRAAEGKYTKLLAEKKFGIAGGQFDYATYNASYRRAYTVYNVVVLEENMRRAHKGLPPLAWKLEDQKTNKAPDKTDKAKKGGTR